MFICLHKVNIMMFYTCSTLDVSLSPHGCTHTRPMYIDSLNWDEPDGDQPVAILLRSTVEPLLKVMCLSMYLHSVFRHE